MTLAVPEGWFKHDGATINPAPGQNVDLVWGIGIVERQPSDKVNWSFKWTWRPSPNYPHTRVKDL